MFAIIAVQELGFDQFRADPCRQHIQPSGSEETSEQRGEKSSGKNEEVQGMREGQASQIP
jgi:hypothetical protein